MWLIGLNDELVNLDHFALVTIRNIGDDEGEVIAVAHWQTVIINSGSLQECRITRDDLKKKLGAKRPK